MLVESCVVTDLWRFRSKCTFWIFQIFGSSFPAFRRWLDFLWRWHGFLLQFCFVFTFWLSLRVSCFPLYRHSTNSILKDAVKEEKSDIRQNKMAGFKMTAVKRWATATLQHWWVGWLKGLFWTWGRWTCHTTCSCLRAILCLFYPLLVILFLLIHVNQVQYSYELYSWLSYWFVAVQAELQCELTNQPQVSSSFGGVLLFGRIFLAFLRTQIKQQDKPNAEQEIDSASTEVQYP